MTKKDSIIASKFDLSPFQLKLEKIYKAAKNEVDQPRDASVARQSHRGGRGRSLFSNAHRNSFRRLNEPQWLCHGPLEQNSVGEPAPGNFTLYLPDGNVQPVAEGDLMQNHMVGGMACPCYDMPAGAIAPVAGTWEGTHPVPAGTTTTHPGRLCMTLPASIEDYNFTKSNICKNPMDFNPSAVYDGENNTCANLAQICHSFRKDGGIVPAYLLHIQQNFVPTCCNGKAEYNDDSGCGKSEAATAPIDYCDGGEFDPDHILEFDCRSPAERDDNPDYDEAIEECHTEECRKSAIGCIAARGKEVEHHPGKNYSMQLAPREVKCSERIPYYCSVLSGTMSTDGQPQQGVACTFLNEDGSSGICLDANCHKSREECLSRAGTTNQIGQTYPTTMIFNNASATKPDVNDQVTLSGLSRGYSAMKHMMNEQGCCKSGSYTNACLFSELKQKIEETTKRLEENNICKNPKDFTPDAHHGMCTTFANICHSVRDKGGINPTYKSHIPIYWVPMCCNGTTEYNDDSGCGAIEPVDNDYCEGGEYDPDHILEFDCRSPAERDDNPDYDEAIEECHTEECRKSAIGCIAARGKEVEHHPGKNYSMQLAPREVKCRDRVQPYCAGLSSAMDAATPQACTYLNDEGEVAVCFDADCHKSEEECLSRAGTAIPFQPGAVYPSNMIYNNATKSDALDIQKFNHFNGLLYGMKYIMNVQGCCKTGTYKDACASKEMMQLVNKFSLCKDPGQFDPSAYISEHHQCTYEESCAKRVLVKGVCFNPYDPQDECHDERCGSSAEECSEIRPGFKFRALTYADLALSSMRSKAYSASCCVDQRMNDECDTGIDSYLVEPPMGMCKDMTLYTPNVKYGDSNLTCAYLNEFIPLRHVFHKGVCGEMVDGNLEERCDDLCQASKEVCESMGYTFQPYTELRVQADSAYMASMGLGEKCCGRADNAITYLSTTKYIKDGSPAAPTPGSCSKDTCCGTGTVWEDGFGCVPTRKGVIDACKNARGKWGWTCEHEQVCA